VVVMVDVMVAGVLTDRELGKPSVACLSYCPAGALLQQILDYIFGHSIEKQ